MKKINVRESILRPRVDLSVLDSFYDEVSRLYYKVDHVEELSGINKKIISKVFEYCELAEHEIEISVPESTIDIKQNYNPEFIAEILSAFNQYNYRIHATSNAESILQSGLLVRDSSKEINYTSLPFMNMTDNEILYNLFNNMHMGRKQIIVLDANNEDLIRYKGKYKVPVERIKCYIDIATQTVVQNSKYKPLNRAGERVVQASNDEIIPPQEKGFIDKQIGIFKQHYHVDSTEEISRSNCEIYEYIMSLILQLSRGYNIIMSNEEKANLMYFVSQIDNDIYRSLKSISEQEKSQQSAQSHMPNSDEVTMDNTDDLF